MAMHTHPAANSHRYQAACNAIKALVDGFYDDPYLLAVGVLFEDRLTTVKHILEHIENINWPDPKYVEYLMARGFTIGKRDERLNQNYLGLYMVTEASPDELETEYELPTQDGSNGPWCVVGDDIGSLVQTAYDAWAD